MSSRCLEPCTLFCTQNRQERDTASISGLSCHPRTFFLFLMFCSIRNTFTQAALHCYPPCEAAVLGNVQELVNTGSCVALILCTHMNAAPSFVGHSEYFGWSRGVSGAISSHISETLKRKEAGFTFRSSIGWNSFSKSPELSCGFKMVTAAWIEDFSLHWIDLD